MERRGELPVGMSREKIRLMLWAQKKVEKRAAGVGRNMVWEFENIKPLKPDKNLFIRFKYEVSVNPPDLNVFGRWLVGDYRQIKYGGKVETPIYSVDRKDSIRTFHEIAVPADAIAADGYLAVVFENVPLNKTVVIFPPEDGLQVLYEADTFFSNYIRAVLLILIRLVFLAVLGIVVSTWVSFPVAILVCMLLLFIGTMSGFIMESFELLSAGWGSFYKYSMLPIVKFLPQFDKVNPSKFMVAGEFIKWSLVARLAMVMIFTKALFLFLIGIFIFSRREIAKITV